MENSRATTEGMKKALDALRNIGISMQDVVRAMNKATNTSTEGCKEFSEALGSLVVPETTKGVAMMIPSTCLDDRVMVSGGMSLSHHDTPHHIRGCRVLSMEDYGKENDYWSNGWGTDVTYDFEVATVYKINSRSESNLSGSYFSQYLRKFISKRFKHTSNIEIGPIKTNKGRLIIRATVTIVDLKYNSIKYDPSKSNRLVWCMTPPPSIKRTPKVRKRIIEI